MPVESAADRAAYLHTDEFGASAVWTSAGGEQPAFACVFDAEYQLLASPLLDGGAEGSQPQFVCRTADLPGDAAQGDTVALTSLDDAGASVALGAFTVVEIMPDGTGMTAVRLQEG